MGKKEKVPENNFIYDYYHGINDGKYCVGKWIKLVYKYIIEGLENSEFFFNAERANDAIEWIEKHCFHTEGPLAPNPLKLEVWQKAMLSAIYGIVNKDGNQRFREILLVVARKNGKSLLSSSVANYTWKQSGYGARVFCVSPKVDQADIIYNCIWNMTQLDPEWQELKKKCSVKNAQRLKVNDDSKLARHRQTDLCIPGENARVKKVSYFSRDLNGYNPSVTITDEVASWEGTRGLQAFETMRSAMGARPDSFILACTTSGYVNDSIYDELVKRATRFLLGDSKERRLLPFLYMIDDIEKWNDIEELKKSNPNLGVSVTEDYMEEEIAVALGSLSKKNEFLCKYCCVKSTSSTAWLDAKAVEDMGGPPLKLEDFRNSYCVGGIDLSQTTDLTSCCVVIEKNGQLFVFSKFFLPAERIQDAIQKDGVPYDIFMQRGLLQASGQNYVDYHDCYNWFVELVEKWQILPLQIGYDRYSAQYLVQDMTAYGFHMDDVFQGDNLHGVIQETQGLIEDRRIHVGDNDLLKSHLLNSALKISVERGRGKLVKLRPTLHIDGTAALLDAMTVRQKHYGEIGEQLKNVTV